MSSSSGRGQDQSKQQQQQRQTREAREIQDPDAKKQVREEVDKAVKLLRRVTDPNDKEFAKEGRPALTGDELINAPGLSFQFLRKVGVGVGVLQGHGFVVQRLGTSPGRAGDAGGIGWSAPLFYSVTGLSVGVEVGWADVHTLAIPASKDDIKNFLKRTVAFGGDAGIKIGRKRAGGGGSTTTGEPLVFSTVASGAIVDLSLNGASISRNDTLIKKVYGQVDKPEDILEGRIPPPQEMKPLYDELKRAVEVYGNYLSTQSGQPDVPVVLTYAEIVTYIDQDDLTAPPTYDTGIPAFDDPLSDFPDVDLDTPVGFDTSLLDSLPRALTGGIHAT